MVAKLHRVQEVILPLLRDKLPGVTITTWIPDIDHRDFPLINIRRLGGIRHAGKPNQLDLPVVEMTVYSTEGLVEAEDLYQSALEVLYDAQRYQTHTGAGYVHSVFETMGMTQFDSLNMDSWRIQGLIQVGIRPPRT